MKISPELLILTREHHISLSLGNKAVNTAKSKNNADIEDLCLQISKTFRESFHMHFETEESTIFAPLKGKSSEIDALCERLIKEHQQLYQLAEGLVEHPHHLAEFGELLKTHSRIEDRELFPHIDLLSTSERQAVLKASEKHLPVAKI